MKKNSKQYKKIISLIWILLIIFMFLLGCILINKAKNIYNSQNEKMIYVINKSTNYNILLKPNTFYTETFLPADMCYASKSIDKIQLNLRYKYNAYTSSENEYNDSKIKYNYKIYATLIGKALSVDNLEKEIWRREEKILADKFFEKENGKDFLINENVSIDYQKYNDLVKEYEKEYGIAIDGMLKIILEVQYELENKDFENKNLDYIEIEIPITNTVTEVKQNYEKVSTNEIPLNNTNNSMSLYLCFGFGLLSIIVSMLIIFIKIFKNKLNKLFLSSKKDNINYILKYYKELIITVITEPDISNLKVMNVEKMEDLINIALQNHCNIIRYKNNEDLANKFYVIIGDFGYFFDYKKEKNEM